MDMVNVRDLFRKQEEYVDQTVTIGGWVRSISNSKNFGFIVVNDGTFFEPVQVVYSNVLENFDDNGRRRYLLHRFKEMGLSCFEPFGAFYVFPCISEFGMTSEQFATELLNTEKLAVVPGTAFGDCGEGFIRIYYAYSLENLKEAMNRMEAFITGLRKQGEKQA